MHATTSTKVATIPSHLQYPHNPPCFQKQDAAIADLQSQIDELQAQLGPGADAEKIVKSHIRLLHAYNDVKDAAQVLIGRLATVKETTVTEIHRDLDLPDKD
ncbi:Swi5-domain-containing protein [Pterulicium gracile]|uniref:Swi5-domain-containing protein n=1 Tax=Pterulicium gracile TaxID=1884261 RepID=A0A5C3QBA1_9AGAR|nr:Swi5-domain-containing protein [Pterula gracilis]